MKNWMIMVAVLTMSGFAYGSGGVHCQKDGDTLPPVTLSWGTGRVEGSGRISGYRFALSGREWVLFDAKDPPTLRQVLQKGVPQKSLVEVGYWNDRDKKLVRLADEQLLRTVVLLSTRRHDATQSFKGTLTIDNLNGMSLHDVAVTCTVE